MKTVKPIIHWGELFNQNGIPHSHFQTVIDENKVPLIEHGSISAQSESPHSIILWNQQIPEAAHTKIDIARFLNNQLANKNGTAHQYSFSGIELPEKDPDIIKRKISFYVGREKRRNSFGEWLWQQFKENHFNIRTLATLMMNIRFEPAYTKDPDNDTAIKKLSGATIHHDDCGIYLIGEHAPNDPHHTIVYVGKSLGAMGTTMWCHFNEWHSKYHPAVRPKGSRGEDRGMWREKIMEGYSYSVGLIKILPEKHGFTGINHQQLLDLERKLIQIFSPRDNIKDKLYLDENQVELFDSKLVEDLKDEQSPGDDVPF